MKTRCVAACAALAAQMVLSACVGTSRPAPRQTGAEAAPGPDHPASWRVVNPFGERAAALPSDATDAARTPRGDSMTAPVADGSRPGLSTAPSYDIFGSAPRTRLPGVDETASYEATENVRRITSADEGADFDPAVSPDGAWVYFASTRHRATSDLYVKRVDGTAVTLLTNDASNDVMPAVSPDGKRIAFASNRAGSYDIYVMSASGGRPVQITSDPGHELKPTWSPDGKSIAFCRLPEGRGGRTPDRWEIWVSEVNRPSDTRFLTFGLFPTWQPGGDKIAFQRARERGSRYFSVWTIDYTDGDALNPTEVVSSPVAACINPTWSPDGRFIAFATVMSPESVPEAGFAPAPGRLSPNQADLWIVRADGSSRAPLTAGASANLSPVWGPGGRVFFVSNRSGGDSLWSIGAEQALVAMGDHPTAPTTKARGAPAPGASERETAQPGPGEPAAPATAEAEDHGAEGEPG